MPLPPHSYHLCRQRKGPFVPPRSFGRHLLLVGNTGTIQHTTHNKQHTQQTTHTTHNKQHTQQTTHNTQHTTNNTYSHRNKKHAVITYSHINIHPALESPPLPYFFKPNTNLSLTFLSFYCSSPLPLATNSRSIIS